MPQPAQAVAPSPAPLVVIDPGHGGRYSNANANGLKEKNVNLAIARELRTALLARGYRVLMTRNSDARVRKGDAPTWVYSSSTRTWGFRRDHRTGIVGGIPRDDLQARVDYANAKGADLFISIHANGAASRASRGTETWASPKDYLGRRLAAVVHREIVRATSLRDRGTHTADFYVCRWSNMPAILVESAFISNPSDAHLLKQPGYRRRIAEAIATGVDSWMASAPYRKRFPRVVAGSSAELANVVSEMDFPDGADTVVIARADLAAEVPGVAGLATRLGAPLLWTEPGGPSANTATELARLAPQQVVLAGVDGSFDATCAAALCAASGVPTSGAGVVGGPTPAAVAAGIASVVGVPASGEVLLVRTGDTRASLAAAAVSAAKGVPLLLTAETTLGADARGWIAANRPATKRAITAGKAGSFSATALKGTPGIVRISTADGAQAAAKLNARYYPQSRARTLRPVVVSASSKVQYLVAATYAARRGQPVLPVGTTALPAYSREWITNRREAIGGFEVMSNGSLPYLMDWELTKADAQLAPCLRQGGQNDRHERHHDPHALPATKVLMQDDSREQHGDHRVQRADDGRECHGTYSERHDLTDVRPSVDYAREQRDSPCLSYRHHAPASDDRDHEQHGHSGRARKDERREARGCRSLREADDRDTEAETCCDRERDGGARGAGADGGLLVLGEHAHDDHRDERERHAEKPRPAQRSPGREPHRSRQGTRERRRDRSDHAHASGRETRVQGKHAAPAEDTGAKAPQDPRIAPRRGRQHERDAEEHRKPDELRGEGDPECRVLAGGEPAQEVGDAVESRRERCYESCDHGLDLPTFGRPMIPMDNATRTP